MMVTDCLKDEDEKDVVFFKLKKACLSLHALFPRNPSVPFFLACVFLVVCVFKPL